MARTSRHRHPRVRMLLELEGLPEEQLQAGALLCGQRLADLWTATANAFRNFRHGSRDRPRHEAEPQLGEMGPFRTVDAAGVESHRRSHEKEGKPVATNVEKLRLRQQGLVCWTTAQARSEDARKCAICPPWVSRSSHGAPAVMVGDRSENQWRGEIPARRR